jgi:hypothetical protein
VDNRECERRFFHHGCSGLPAQGLPVDIHSFANETSTPGVDNRRRWQAPGARATL